MARREIVVTQNRHSHWVTFYYNDKIRTYHHFLDEITKEELHKIHNACMRRVVTGSWTCIPFSLADTGFSIKYNG